jgi:polyisoprenoid-binding protein YceI
MKRYITQMMVLFFLVLPILSYGANWQMDPAHSSFQFKIRHLTVTNVKGDFSKLQGVAIIDDQNIT